ncbi:MAG: peptidase dimerization domain-containing protein, partial [Candidatus Hodarchaeales archaeon]
NKMINAIRIISEFIALFPAKEAPETTKEYQGFYHPYNVNASVNEGVIKFILRDFDHDELLTKIEKINKGVDNLKKKYPGAEFDLDLKEAYRNMREIIDKYPKLISLAREAIEKTDIKVIEKPIRGGTDGARMSFKGLPTPNLFTGGMQFHSKKECIPVIAMEKAVEVILNIIEMTANGYLQE